MIERVRVVVVVVGVGVEAQTEAELTVSYPPMQQALRLLQLLQHL